MYEKSLAIQQRTGNEPGLGVTYSNMANAYSRKGDTARALGHYRKALAIFEHIGDQHGAAVNYANLGVLYRDDIGDPALARQYFEKANTLYEILGLSEKAHQTAREMRSL